MTRMEYMLSRLETELDSGEQIIREYLAEGFNSLNAESVLPRSFKGFALYSQETGRIIVGYRIQHSARPTKPIRASCEKVLDHLALSIPQSNLGYILHHIMLGALAQENFDKYTSILTTLAKNIVHRAILVIEYSGVTYGLACQRTGKGAPIQYHRFSF